MQYPYFKKSSDSESSSDSRKAPDLGEVREMLPYDVSKDDVKESAIQANRFVIAGATAAVVGKFLGGDDATLLFYTFLVLFVAFFWDLMIRVLVREL